MCQRGDHEHSPTPGIDVAVAQRRPSCGPERFIGVDLSPNQIELCRKANKNPKVHFYAADGVSWIKQNMAIGGGLLITIGTLEYFTNAELKTFLTLAHDGNWAIALLEPIGPLDDYQNFESVPRGNL